MDFKENHSENQRKIGLCQNPNCHARPYSYEDRGDSIVFHGYQEFILGKDHLNLNETNDYLNKKAHVGRQILSSYLVKNRTVLDLGANSGLYCFYSLLNNAKQATAVEIDKDYISGLLLAKERFKLQSFEILEKNFENLNQSADIVIALAVIHWFYSCTSRFGNLKKVIQKLASLTNYALIIEWVEPTDPAIQSFDHIHWNEDIISGPYDIMSFEEALNQYFQMVKFVADLSPTRKIFVAYKTRNEISFDAPFPFIQDCQLISSRILTYEDDIPYWSQIYDCGDHIIKQATLDLASREGLIINSLGPGPFPRVLDIQQYDGYSIIKLSKINGISIDQVDFSHHKSKEVVLEYVEQLLSILRILKNHGVTHRDIHPSNILVTNDQTLFLIDFGWAISSNYLYFTPKDLAMNPRLTDGTFSDLFSIGEIIKIINNSQYEDIDDIVNLMDNKYHASGISDLNVIDALFKLCRNKSKQTMSAEQELILGLLHQIRRDDDDYNQLRKDIIELQSISSFRIEEINKQKEELREKIGELTGTNQGQASELEKLINRVDELNNEIHNMTDLHEYMLIKIKQMDSQITELTIQVEKTENQAKDLRNDL